MKHWKNSWNFDRIFVYFWRHKLAAWYFGGNCSPAANPFPPAESDAVKHRPLTGSTAIALCLAPQLLFTAASSPDQNIRVPQELPISICHRFTRPRRITVRISAAKNPHCAKTFILAPHTCDQIDNNNRIIISLHTLNVHLQYDENVCGYLLQYSAQPKYANQFPWVCGQALTSVVLNPAVCFKISINCVKVLDDRTWTFIMT